MSSLNYHRLQAICYRYNRHYWLIVLSRLTENQTENAVLRKVKREPTRFIEKLKTTGKTIINNRKTNESRFS